MQKSMLENFAKYPARTERFALLLHDYLNNGAPWKVGDRFVSPQARVLELIAEGGSDAFYKGAVAEAIIAEMKRGRSSVSANELAETKPVVRQPLIGQFDGATILAMPPPSSGGVAILESLNVLTEWEKKHPDARLADGTLDSASSQHVLTEILKFAFADRAENLGDADFVKVPVEQLTSAEYAAEIAGKIDPQKTKRFYEYGKKTGKEDNGTSHFSIIDAAGNAVACTETINLAFGSYVVVPEYGIILNNQMDDFATDFDKPNAFGLFQGEANAIEPKKKPLSSMSPTIVVRDGKAIFALGGSGGPRIISSTLQVLLRMMRQNMSPADAVAAPRIHHQWLPEELEIEAARMETLRPEMERFGHKVKGLSAFPAVQAVSRDGQGTSGGSDPRKHGKPAGY